MSIPYFIADIGSNHNRDWERCAALIRKVSGIGCDAVKFQLFKGTELYWAGATEAIKTVTERELPIEFLPKIRKMCNELNLDLVITPFDLNAVKEVATYADVIKIASYELLWLNLIKEAAETGLPLILSTGLANIYEVLSAIRCAIDAGCKQLTVLHCVATYPARPQDSNLQAIDKIRSTVGCMQEMYRDTRDVNFLFGWSDHTITPIVIQMAAVEFKSDIIEFHLDLDGHGLEWPQGHCWLPEDISPIMTTVKLQRAIVGDGIKAPIGSEIDNRVQRTDPSDGFRPMKSERK